MTFILYKMKIPKTWQISLVIWKFLFHCRNLNLGFPLSGRVCYHYNTGTTFIESIYYFWWNHPHMRNDVLNATRVIGSNWEPVNIYILYIYIYWWLAFKIWTAVPRVEKYTISAVVQILEIIPFILCRDDSFMRGQPPISVTGHYGLFFHIWYIW